MIDNAVPPILEVCKPKEQFEEKAWCLTLDKLPQDDRSRWMMVNDENVDISAWGAICHGFPSAIDDNTRGEQKKNHVGELGFEPRTLGTGVSLIRQCTRYRFGNIS